VQCDVTASADGLWGFTLESCTLAGLWGADDFLHQLSQFPDPLTLLDTKPLCISSGAYPAFKRTLCELVDTYSGVPGSSAACDALSFGMAFDMVPALLGPVYNVPPVSGRCPAEFDPASDSCASLRERPDSGLPSGDRDSGPRTVADSGPPLDGSTDATRVREP
jgi:hypothetical protein